MLRGPAAATKQRISRIMLTYMKQPHVEEVLLLGDVCYSKSAKSHDIEFFRVGKV